jgi:lysozyme
VKISDDGLRLIRESEGCKLASYQDPVGIWTIGVGHTRGVAMGLTCLPEQAEAWLQEDVRPAELAVMRLVEVSMTQGQFDALVSFVFNLGAEAFADSALLRKLNHGDYAGAAEEFDRWVHAGNAVLPGLVTRRARERAMFGGNS